jgi:CheY-like chemotaxis protein
MAHILVADDSATVRTVLRGWLESAGHTVREASDGERTLQALRDAQQPMVILLDYLMPGMTGDQVLHRALNLGYVPPRFIYLIVSGLTGDFPAAFNDLLQRLSIQILPKPFDQHRLLSVVAFLASFLDAPTPSVSRPTGSPAAAISTAFEPVAPESAAAKRRFPWRR